MFKYFKTILLILILLSFCASCTTVSSALTKNVTNYENSNEKNHKLPELSEKDKYRIILKEVHQVVVDSKLRQSLRIDNENSYIFYKYLKLSKDELLNNADLTYCEVVFFIEQFKTMLFENSDHSSLLYSIKYICKNLNLYLYREKEPLAIDARKFLLVVLTAIEIEAEKALKDMMI